MSKNKTKRVRKIPRLAEIPVVDIPIKTYVLAIILSALITLSVAGGLIWCCEHVWKQDGARVAHPELVYKRLQNGG